MEKKIDKRRNYICILDTETANTIVEENGKLNMNYVLPYDLGYSIIDTRGNVYLEKSFVIQDIFCDEYALMTSAYYCNKIPRYIKDLANGKRILSTAYNARKNLLQDMQEYDTKIVCAHNMRFDLQALNNLMRWTTKSKYRYFFPHDIIFYDTLAMARSVMVKMPTFTKFCKEYQLLTATGKLSTTAETLYKFITKNPDFVESHTGLEDVQIEREILHYCYRQKKAMKKDAFTKKS